MPPPIMQLGKHDSVPEVSVVPVVLSGTTCPKATLGSNRLQPIMLLAIQARNRYSLLDKAVPQRFTTFPSIRIHGVHIYQVACNSIKHNNP